MIKVNIMYPYSDGVRFDHTYYRDKHMPMVSAKLGSALSYYTVEKGLSGGARGAAPTYVATCSLVCDSVEAFQAAMRTHGSEIMADTANYTDAKPVIQVSEVVVERS